MQTGRDRYAGHPQGKPPFKASGNFGSSVSSVDPIPAIHIHKVQTEEDWLIFDGMFRRRQGENLHRLIIGNQPQPQLVNIDHLLPLPLQDFCLLRVISDLDGYPVELLASLPRWLRYRILNNLPALDLCRLDHTAVATGIDTDNLWETRLQILTKPRMKSPAGRGAQHILRSTSQSTASVETDQSLFQLDLPQIFNFTPLSRFQPNNRQLVESSPILKEKVTSAFNDVRECPGMEMSSARDKFLSNIVSNFLYHSPNLDNIHHLVSIPGEHLLPNLVFASHHQSVTPRHSYFVWRKQATPLTLQHTGPPPLPFRRHGRNQLSTGSRLLSLYDSYSCIALTPHRMVSSFIVNRSSLQMLSLLVNDCGVQPTSANICVNKMSQEIVDSLYTARVAQENDFKVSADCTTCISVMHHLLKRVVILKL